jgi:hypothetical protein
MGTDVLVSSNGRLGIGLSSARYKDDIRDMGNASAALMKLRPVSFRYNNDPSRTAQYGLVAEEVERVYPELVTYRPDGKVQSVPYLELTAMLLNGEGESRASLGDAHVRTQQAQVRTEQARERAGFDERLAALEGSVSAGKPAARLSAAAFPTRARPQVARP